MRIMICYGTTEGQSRKVAEFAAGIVRRRGHEPALFDAGSVSELESPARSQAAILAGSVHMGRYQTPLVHHIRRWHDALNAIPSVFISVSMAAAGSDPHERSEMDETVQRMLRETGWDPDATLHVAGALRFTRYGFFKRWAMKLVARQKGRSVDTHSDYEYTDWQAVTEFVEAFLARLPASGAT